MWFGSHERRGCVSISRDMRRFSDFRNSRSAVMWKQLHLVWCSRERCMSRIDQFLFPGSWEEHFSSMAQFSLTRPISYHIPILLDSGGLHQGNTPFKLENMWLLSEGLVERVGEWWGNYSTPFIPN